jgi:hypothetical protein
MRRSQNKSKIQKKFKILILTHSCYGLGDAMFAIRIRDYIKDWYNINAKLITHNPKKFYTLGEKKSNLILLKIKSDDDCDNFENMEFVKKKKLNFDILLVAPLTGDFFFPPNPLSDINKLIPEANEKNTFFLSVYNDMNKKAANFYTFPTGIGKNKLGFLLTDIKVGSKPANIGKHYAFSYIAHDEGNVITGSDKCLYEFINMIINKYDYNEIEVIVPQWFKLTGKMISDILQTHNIEHISKKNKLKYGKSQNYKLLKIRADILPVSNKMMLSYMKHSLNDILLTGNQSVSDLVSCCTDKILWYQHVPWNVEFAKQLAKEIPNKFLENYKTSCGNLTAIKLNMSNISKLKKWDFRKLAKPKMDSIIKSIINL